MRHNIVKIFCRGSGECAPSAVCPTTDVPLGWLLPLSPSVNAQPKRGRRGSYLEVLFFLLPANISGTLYRYKKINPLTCCFANVQGYMELETLIERSLTDNEIRELHLYKLPILKTCDNWMAVKELGRVSFQGRHVNYSGALVKYGEKIYYVGDARIEALAPYRKWDMRKKIEVIKETDFKKRKKK